MPKNIYRLSSGEIVPGCTTICNLLGKGDALINWAWKLGKEGRDWREERDSAGDIGTLVHELVLDFLSGNEAILTGQDIKVQNCFRKFLDWWRQEVFPLKTHQSYPTLITETPLVSEKLGFGGQPDIYIEAKKNRLIDVKTSNGIYDSFWLQLAGYDILLRENGYKVDEYQILWLPKHDDFACPIRKNLTKEKKIFKCLLEIYKLRNLSNKLRRE